MPLLTDASVISERVWCLQTGAVNSVPATRCVTYVYTVITSEEHGEYM